VYTCGFGCARAFVLTLCGIFRHKQCRAYWCEQVYVFVLACLLSFAHRAALKAKRMNKLVEISSSAKANASQVKHDTTDECVCEETANT